MFHIILMLSRRCLYAAAMLLPGLFLRQLRQAVAPFRRHYQRHWWVVVIAPVQEMTLEASGRSH